jgi:hypothetical protein
LSQKWVMLDYRYQERAPEKSDAIAYEEKTVQSMA